jgi:uroporphyrinogen-III decarboxylase
MLTRGTPNEVEKETKRIIDCLAPLGGHIISSSNSLASYVKAENGRAMIRAIKRNVEQ